MAVFLDWCWLSFSSPLQTAAPFSTKIIPLLICQKLSPFQPNSTIFRALAKIWLNSSHLAEFITFQPFSAIFSQNSAIFSHFQPNSAIFSQNSAIFSHFQPNLAEIQPNSAIFSQNSAIFSHSQPNSAISSQTQQFLPKCTRWGAWLF